jgi:hypothetical protein
VDDFLAWVERQHNACEFLRNRLLLMAYNSTARNDIQANLRAMWRIRLLGIPCCLNAEQSVEAGTRKGGPHLAIDRK